MKYFRIRIWDQGLKEQENMSLVIQAENANLALQEFQKRPEVFQLFIDKIGTVFYYDEHTHERNYVTIEKEFVEIPEPSIPWWPYLLFILAIALIIAGIVI